VGFYRDSDSGRRRTGRILGGWRRSFEVVGMLLLCGALVGCGSARGRHGSGGGAVGSVGAYEGELGPRRLAEEPGEDATRRPLTEGITANTDPRTVAAMRLAEQGRLELEGGTTVRALELLDAALARDPGFGQAYVLRAQVHVAEGSIESAREDLRRAVSIELPPAWLAQAVAVQGGIYESSGDLDAALTLYRRALSISSSNETARVALRRVTAS
jgi:tetratricopeptide (TPR) repeat protein